jgi:hypothetical protein
MSPQAVLLIQWRQSINDATSFRETPLFYLKQQICLMAKLINACLTTLSGNYEKSVCSTYMVWFNTDMIEV